MKRNMTAITAILAALLSLSAGAGCSKGNTGKEVNIGSIRVSKTSLTLKPGESEQLTASAVPAVAVQPAFQWVSADNSIVTVANGLIRAVAVGETKVTVTNQNSSTVITVKVVAANTEENNAELYAKQLNNSTVIADLLLNNAGQYTTEGLNIAVKDKLVKLNKFYAAAERKVQYRIKFSADAKAVFQSSEGDFSAYVDVPNKRISIATTPATEAAASFLQANREYLIEIYHIYQLAKIRVVDVLTGQAAEVSAVNDGQGGVGKGALQPGFAVGMQWDYYCFGLAAGSSMLVKHLGVFALKKKVKLLMFGDSISQPEGYYSISDFPQSWTQLVINKLGGDAMSSGRGGGRVDMLLDYIKNELPHIEAKYVMVTIGTNGGNTEAKLTQLVEYIKSQGAIPILNNIPSNESGTQVQENALIAQVRAKLGIKGCLFDIATSLHADGKEVDKSTMYWEDYTGTYGWQIYHHPNSSGGKKMFDRTGIDVPEIYK